MPTPWSCQLLTFFSSVQPPGMQVGPREELDEEGQQIFRWENIG